MVCGLEQIQCQRNKQTAIYPTGRVAMMAMTVKTGPETRYRSRIRMVYKDHSAKGNILQNNRRTGKKVVLR